MYSILNALNGLIIYQLQIRFRKIFREVFFRIRFIRLKLKDYFFKKYVALFVCEREREREKVIGLKFAFLNKFFRFKIQQVETALSAQTTYDDVPSSSKL